MNESKTTRDRILSKLYRESAQDLTSLMRRRFGNGPPDAEDFVQIAFTQMAALPNLSEIQNLQGYLYTAAFRNGLQHKRHSLVVAKSFGQVVAMYADQAQSIEDPARVVEARSSLDKVKATLDALPPKHREAVWMRANKGLSCGAIGKELGACETSVINWCNRAAAKCRDAVDPNETQSPL